jgi:hypothetical protein
MTRTRPTDYNRRKLKNEDPTPFAFMFANRPLTCLLLAATVSIDAVAFVWGAGTTTGGIIFASLVFAQVGLLAIWAATADSGSWWRWGLLVSSIPLCAWFIIQSEERAPVAQLDREFFMVVCSVLGVHAALVLMLAWILSKSLFSIDPAVRRQFQIRHLLLLMTLVGILSLLLRWLSETQATPSLLLSFWVLSTIVAGLALVCMGRANLWLRFIGGSLLTGVLVSIWTGDVLNVSFALVQALVYAVWLGVVQYETKRAGLTPITRVAP